jgi:hypothetical protein
MAKDRLDDSLIGGLPHRRGEAFESSKSSARRRKPAGEFNPDPCDERRLPVAKCIENEIAL